LDALIRFYVPAGPFDRSRRMIANIGAAFAKVNLAAVASAKAQRRQKKTIPTNGLWRPVCERTLALPCQEKGAALLRTGPREWEKMSIFATGKHEDAQSILAVRETAQATNRNRRELKAYSLARMPSEISRPIGLETNGL
jgi:hypothetical protein